MKTREKHRAEMPLSAEMVDEVRASCPEAKVLWVKEGDKELGRRPALEPKFFEISAETFDMLRQHAKHTAGRGRR